MRKSVLGAGLLVAGLIIISGRSSAHAQEANVSEQQPQNVVVEVVKGDSLSKIANKHETTYQRLFDANTNISDPDVIHPGDKVRVPSPDEQIPSRTAAVAASQRAKTKPVQTAKPAQKKAVVKPKKQVQSTAPSVAGGSVWDALAKCESSGNWSINTGNGYYGGLQFTLSTWRAVGGTGLPSQASREEQIMRGQILQARSGWGQWPACTAKLGLR